MLQGLISIIYNPQPSTSNHQPSTLSHQPPIINQPSVINHQQPSTTKAIPLIVPNNLSASTPTVFAMTSTHSSNLLVSRPVLVLRCISSSSLDRCMQRKDSGQIQFIQRGIKTTPEAGNLEPPQRCTNCTNSAPRILCLFEINRQFDSIGNWISQHSSSAQFTLMPSCSHSATLDRLVHTSQRRARSRLDR